MGYNQDHYKDYNNTTSDYDWYIGSSGTICNAGTFTNSGTLDITGTLTSTGTITAESGGTIDVEGTLTSTGTITAESGCIVTIESGSTIDIEGDLTATGTLTVEGAGTLDIEGTLTSTGTITAESGCIVTIESGSTLDIEGDLTSTGTLTIEASGTLDVEGTLTSTGTLTLEAGGSLGLTGLLKSPPTAYTTASTGTAVTHANFITVSSTKTTKNITLFGSTLGERMFIYCKNASATGYFDVQVNSSAGGALTFDGSNDVYRFKKAGEYVEIIKATTARWIELARSNADGTALTSTST